MYNLILNYNGLIKNLGGKNGKILSIMAYQNERWSYRQ